MSHSNPESQPIGPTAQTAARGTAPEAGPAERQVHSHAPLEASGVNRPLVRLRVRSKLREELAKKRGRGSKAKALSAKAQEESYRLVDDALIDAAAAEAASEEGMQARPLEGPFFDWLISSGLIDKIVEILLKWLGV